MFLFSHTCDSVSEPSRSSFSSRSNFLFRLFQMFLGLFPFSLFPACSRAESQFPFPFKDIGRLFSSCILNDAMPGTSFRLPLSLKPFHLYQITLLFAFPPLPAKLASSSGRTLPLYFFFSLLYSVWDPPWLEGKILLKFPLTITFPSARGCFSFLNLFWGVALPMSQFLPQGFCRTSGTLVTHLITLLPPSPSEIGSTSQTTTLH